jgi:hypothetical protein
MAKEKYEIKRWTDNTVIFSGDYGSLAECIVDAVSKKADLSRANLSRADLFEANLSGADLSGANLSRVNLSGANLSGADLSGANLSRADLSRADLSRADLSRADLSGAKNIDAYFQFGPVGSRHSTLVYNATKNIFQTGCFFGTKAELMKALKEKHGEDEHYKPYLIAIKSLEALAKAAKP